MTKKTFILASLVAMVIVAAAPIALAHEGQAGVVGPQPVAWTGEEATITGLLEPGIEKLDGTPTWQMEDKTSGGFYHVEQGDGIALAPFEGRKVSLHGVLGHLEGAVILVDSVEPLEEATAVAVQYEFGQEEVVEEFSGTGVVEYVDNKANGTPVYGLSVSSEEGHYMEGDFNFSAFEGEKVNVTGQIVYSPESGSFLRVESIEPVAGAGGEDGQPTDEDETVPASSPEPGVVEDEVEGTIPVAAPEADLVEDVLAEETVAVDLASEKTPLPFGLDQESDEPGLFSTAVNALPTTGGAALLLPLAGLGLAAVGLAAFRITR